MLGAGFVLAGGQSSRMGRDKAVLRYRGETFLQRAVRILKSLGLEVSIVANRKNNAWLQKDLGARILLDEIDGVGPLGGLLTALKSSSSKNNYFLPCDMPFVEPDFFRLIEPFTDEFDVVAAEDRQGCLHPLCGYYSNHCLSSIQQLIDRGDRKVSTIFRAKEVKALTLQASELGIPDSMFFNANTPADLEQLDLEGGQNLY